MVGSLAYAIMVTGCSDDMSMCSEMVSDNRAFATLDECKAAQDMALRSNVALEIEYPVVAAKCIPGSERFAEMARAYIGQ